MTVPHPDGEPLQVVFGASGGIGRTLTQAVEQTVRWFNTRRARSRAG